MSQPDDYLERILTSRVYDVAVESPLDVAHNLSRRLNNQILLKREDLQPVFSFKCRGAYNKMAKLTAAQLARGVVAASAGNHAQGVALAAQKLGATAIIVMPATTPKIKVDVMAGQGTVAMELLRQHPGPIHSVYIPVGGGGLIAGMAAYIKRLRPEIRI